MDSQGRHVSSTTTRDLVYEIHSEPGLVLTTLYFDEECVVTVNPPEITAMYLPNPYFVTEVATELEMTIAGTRYTVPLTSPEYFSTPCQFTLVDCVTITEGVNP